MGLTIVSCQDEDIPKGGLAEVLPLSRMLGLYVITKLDLCHGGSSSDVGGRTVPRAESATSLAHPA